MHHNFSIKKRILTVLHSYCKHGVDPCYACACSTTSIIVLTQLPTYKNSPSYPELFSRPRVLRLIWRILSWAVFIALGVLVTFTGNGTVWKSFPSIPASLFKQNFQVIGAQS